MKNDEKEFQKELRADYADLDLGALGKEGTAYPALTYNRLTTQVPLDKPDSNLFSAVFFRENTIGSLLSRPEATAFDPDKNTNLDYLQFVPKRHMNQFDAYALVTNDQEALSVMRTVDEENERTRMIEENPWKSFFYGLAAQFPLIEPVNLFPGSILFKNVTRMSNVAKSALQAGAAGVISSAAQEVMIQGNQLTRSIEESIMNPIVAGIFSTAIGGAAHYAGPKIANMSAKAKERAKREIMNVLVDNEVKLTPYSPHGSAGSMGHISGNTLANMPKIIQKGMKTSLMNDMMTSEFQAPKDVAAELFQNNYTLTKNESGIPTTNVETAMKLDISKTVPTFIEYQNIFFEQAGVKKGFLAETRANRAAKNDPTGAILNYEKFESEVAQTIFSGEKHANEGVNKAAKLLTDNIFEPFKNAAIELKLLPEGVSPKNAFAYFSVHWNQQKIKENQTGFFNMTRDYFMKINDVVSGIHQNADYKADVADIKDTKLHIRRAKRGVLPEEAKKLTRHLGKLEKDLRRTVKNVAKSPEYRKAEAEIIAQERKIRASTLAHKKADVKAMRQNLGALKTKLTQVKNSVKGFGKHTDYVSLGLDLKLSEALRKEAHAEVVIKYKDLKSAKAKLAEARAKLKKTKSKEAKSLEIERLQDMEIELLQDNVHTLEKEMKQQREQVTKHQTAVEKIKERQAAIEKSLNKKAKAISAQTLREIKKYPEYKELLLDIKKAKEMIEKSGKTPEEVKLLKKELTQLEDNLKKTVRQIDKSPEYKEILAKITDTKEQIKESKKQYSHEGVKALKEKLEGLEKKLKETAEQIAGRTLKPDEIGGIFHSDPKKKGRLRKVTEQDVIDLNAKQTLDRIIGNDGSRLKSPLLNQLNKKAAPLNDRSFLIPQRVAWEWQNQNASDVARSYVHAMAPVLRMNEFAKSLDYKSVADWHAGALDKLHQEMSKKTMPPSREAMKAHYDHLKAESQNPKYNAEQKARIESQLAAAEKDLKKKKSPEKEAKAAAELDKNFKKQSQNITNAFELLLGIYGDGPNIHDNSAAKYYKAFLNWNYVRLLGFMTLSAIPDVGLHVLTHGPFSSVYDGLRIVLKDAFGIMKNMSKDDIKAIGYGNNTTMGTRLKSMSGHEGLSTQPSFFGRTADKMVEGYGNVTLMNQWNDIQQVWAGTNSINRTLKSIEAYQNGIIDKKEITRLARLGIGIDDYPIIHEFYKAKGGEDGGTYFANWTQWEIKTKEQAKALAAFQRAVATEIDSVVIVPGLGDKPLIAQTNFGKLLLQFKSFAFAATNKVLFAGIQRRHDANTYFGMVSMLAMGGLSYVVSQVLRGNDDIDLSFKKLAHESIDRSGLIGIVSEVYNMAEKAGLGFGTQASRYQSRSLWGALLGPSTGAFDEMFALVNSIRKADGEHPLTTKDFEKLLRLAPYQNLFYTYYLSRKVSGSVAPKLGFEEAQDNRLKDMFK